MPSTIKELKSQYRAAARAGDWKACIELAVQIGRMRIPDEARAEVFYAQGYAWERYGNPFNARSCYLGATEWGHARAAKRLAALVLPRLCFCHHYEPDHQPACSRCPCEGFTLAVCDSCGNPATTWCSRCGRHLCSDDVPAHGCAA